MSRLFLILTCALLASPAAASTLSGTATVVDGDIGRQDFVRKQAHDARVFEHEVGWHAAARGQDAIPNCHLRAPLLLLGSWFYHSLN